MSVGQQPPALIQPASEGMVIAAPLSLAGSTQRTRKLTPPAPRRGRAGC
jgi:hypothetical protein